MDIEVLKRLGIDEFILVFLLIIVLTPLAWLVVIHICTKLDEKGKK